MNSNNLKTLTDGFLVGTTKTVFIDGTNTTLDSYLNTLTSSVGSRLSGKSMCVIGDSLSYPPSGWVYIMKNKRGLSNVTNHAVAGKKISGDTGFIEQVNASDGSEDFVVLMGGTNDANVSYNLGTIDDAVNTTFYGALNNCIKNLLIKYVGKPILVCSPPMGKNDTGINDRLEQTYIPAMEKVCKKWGVRFFDVFHESGMNPTITDIQSILIQDSVHLTGKGYEVIEKSISGILESMV